MNDFDSEDVVVTTTKPEPTTKQGTWLKHQPPYAVVLENDDHHSFEYVIEVLQKVCGHSLQKAFSLTTEAHESGRAVVWSGTLELAELKRDQIREYGPDSYASKPVTFPLGCYVESLC